MINYPSWVAPQAIDFTGNFGAGVGIGQSLAADQRRNRALERIGQLDFGGQPQTQPRGGALSQIGSYVAPQADPVTAAVNAGHAGAAANVDPELSAALGTKYGNSTQPASDPAQIALNYFVERGYSPHQAAGIVGNLMQESGLDVAALNPGDGADGSNSIGIAQWNGPRAQALNAYAAANGGNVNDFMTQLGFVDHELNTSEAGVRDRLMQAQDPIQAAAAFVGYERPQGWSAEDPYASHGWGNRAMYASQIAGGIFAPPQTAADAASALASGIPDVGGGQGQPFSLTPEDLSILMGAEETRPFAQQYLQAQMANEMSSGRFVVEQGPQGAVWQRDRLTGETKVLIDPGTPDDGLTDTQRNLMWRAEQAGLQPGTPEYQQFIASGGQGGTSLTVDPASGAVTFQQGGMKLTEGQGKDIGYYTRGAQADQGLQTFEQELTSWGQQQAGMIPLGLGNYLRSPEFRQAKVEADQFLSAILRKDTGAAITSQEFDLYGPMFLPVPGDDPATVNLKRQKRATALMAIRSGLGTAEAVAAANESALGLPGGQAPAPEGATPAPQANGPVARPTTQQEYDALPSGTLFEDPDDGQTYRKP